METSQVPVTVGDIQSIIGIRQPIRLIAPVSKSSTHFTHTLFHSVLISLIILGTIGCVSHQSEEERAISEYSTVLARDPSNVAALIARGYAKGTLGDYNGCISDMNAALAIDPNNTWANLGLAMAHYQLGTYVATVKYASKAMERDPDFWQAYIERGFAKVEL